jgi:hypothetical protein
MLQIRRSDQPLWAAARPRDDLENVLGYFTKPFEPQPHHGNGPMRVTVFESEGTVLAEVALTLYARRVIAPPRS